MAKKNEDLPGIEGPGVAPLEIKDIDKAISKYQRMKSARCEASPGELAVKKEVRLRLHIHRDELPRTAEGVPFYRYDDRDYLLDEKLVIHKVEDETESDKDE